MKSNFVAKYKRVQQVIERQTKMNRGKTQDVVYNPIGVVLAMRVDGVVKFGWSSCDNEDSFCKKRAIELATLRALKGNNRPVPSSISSVVDDSFIAQVEAHFDEEVVIPQYFAMRQGKKKLMVRVGGNELELKYEPYKEEVEEEV